MAFTYAGTPKTVSRDAVRILVGDTIEHKRSLSDAEVAFFLGRHGITDPTTTYSDQDMIVVRAAAEACDALAGKYSADAAFGVAGLSEAANQKSIEYRQRAIALKKMVAAGAAPYLGGRDTADKDTWNADSSIVQPKFKVGQFDNTQADRQ